MNPNTTRTTLDCETIFTTTISLCGGRADTQDWRGRPQRSNIFRRLLLSAPRLFRKSPEPCAALKGIPSASRETANAGSSVTQPQGSSEAKVLEIQWDESAGRREVGLNLVRRIAQPRSGVRCPECEAIIYSRRHKHCGVCGGELPAELLFSKSEALAVERLVSFEREKHRAWMKREGGW